MKLDIIFILFIINVLVNLLILIGIYALKDEVKNSKGEMSREEKTKAFVNCIESAKNKPKFLDIRFNRPPDGSHIFVWDSVEKKAMPTAYQGNEEVWKASKDKETRYTHFVELDFPT